MATNFGTILKRLRLRAGIGLRHFAEMIDIEPSNLSAIEHGRRSHPADPKKLREIADALGLVEDSKDWVRLFDAACNPDELPADVRHLSRRKLVPALLRTIDNRQLDDRDIEELIAEIDQRHGGQDRGGQFASAPS